MSTDNFETMKQTALGAQFADDEVSGDERFVYFDSYGSPPDTFDEIHHLSTSGPAYPTDTVARIQLEKRRKEWTIVAIKPYDTSDPEFTGEWVCDDSRENGGV
jgi:hypothetical protein